MHTRCKEKVYENPLDKRGLTNSVLNVIIPRRPWKRTARHCRRVRANRRISIQGKSLNHVSRLSHQTANSQRLRQPNICQEFFWQDDCGPVPQQDTIWRNARDNTLRNRKRRHIIKTGRSLSDHGSGKSQQKTGDRKNFQCRKCLMPVKTMAIPAASAASITS